MAVQLGQGQNSGDQLEIMKGRGEVAKTREEAVGCEKCSDSGNIIKAHFLRLQVSQTPLLFLMLIN